MASPQHAVLYCSEDLVPLLGASPITRDPSGQPYPMVPFRPNILVRTGKDWYVWPVDPELTRA